MEMFITSSTMNKKLQDDGKMTTTTLPPAAHFPDILSTKLSEASWSKDSYIQNPVSRQPLTNFTIADHYSG